MNKKARLRGHARNLIGLLILLLGVSLATRADVPPRDRFLAAEQALERGDIAGYRRLYQGLRDYPLRPYLDLKELRRRLHRADAREVSDFLRRHDGAPVADLLRRAWLDHLAKRKRWKDYLAFWSPQNSVRRQCLRLQALLATGQRQRAWDEIEKLWLHGRSRPRACDPAFAAWEAAGKRTPELTWKRIHLAMQAGQLRLARYLGKKLPATERVWVSRWIALYRKPEGARDPKRFRQRHPWRETMLAQAVQRLARHDGQAALDLWKTLEKRYPFDEDQRYQVKRRIALALERDPSETAYAWVRGIQPRPHDRRLFSARLNAALLRQDWSFLVRDLRRWPATEQATERWRYWYARALEGIGRKDEAQRRYRELASERSYYGFLAADRIDAPYHLAHRRTPVDSERITRLQRQPGLRRALELHALGRDTDARREWRYFTRKLDKPGLKAAAVLAERAGWHDQAIFTLARTGYWDDLELRFPLQHREIVTDQARRNALDMAWVYAVIRQESAFMRDARSRVGAMGLMQLMPATARQVARRQRSIAPPTRSRLLDPGLNIRLGSAYLKQLMEQLADNPVLATAAYNAGPHRVNRWLPQDRLDADIWVELIPFKETRTYLRRVMSYTVIYDKRLGQEPRRLRERMKPVETPRDNRLAGA